MIQGPWNSSQVIKVADPWFHFLLNLQPALFFTKQEPRKPAESLHARPLPLWLAAVPARGAAEGSHTHGSLSPVRPLRPTLPAPSSPDLLVHSLHPGPRRHLSRPAAHHGTVPDADVPAQPQHGCARLPAPRLGAHLPQPQPDATAAVAVVELAKPRHRKWMQLFFYSFITVATGRLPAAVQRRRDSFTNRKWSWCRIRTVGLLFMAHIQQTLREWWLFGRLLLVQRN